MSPPKNLRLTALQLAGEGNWPDLEIENLSPYDNLFYAPPRGGKSAVAQLIGHLLYGQQASPWRQQFGQTVPQTAGSIRLSVTPESQQTDLGPAATTDLQLRRHEEADAPGRLSISSSQGGAVDGQTVQNLLAGLSPQLAAQVFFVDFAESPRAQALLSKSFAREFSTAPATRLSAGSAAAHDSPPANRQRIDQLLQRRDTIAAAIQQQMSSGRRESDLLQREITATDSRLTSLRQQAGELDSQRQRVQHELRALQTRLRTLTLDRTTAQPRQAQAEVHQELDSEILECRQTLAKLQQREALVQTELAKCTADGTANPTSSLAESRNTLNTLERLLDDLDTEITQLTTGSLTMGPTYQRSAGPDAQAKLAPVATLLRQKVYTLCGLLSEQQRSVDRQQWTHQSRQLARVRVELGERLQQLLARRETLLQQPQHGRLTAPAADHCRCTQHGQFVATTAAPTQNPCEAELRTQIDQLQSQHAQLEESLQQQTQEIQQLEQQWKNLQCQRADLLGITQIDSQQAELERIELLIRQALQTPDAAPTPTWRASDLLAQLSEGRLVQIRLQRDRSQATLVDRHGQAHTLESLTASEHDQLTLALTLSLVSAYANRGIHLPLVLDEPFLQQTSAQAARMASVLHAFAQAGHQLLIFSEDRDVCRRLETGSTRVLHLETLRQTTPRSPRATPAAQKTTRRQTTQTRIVRETLDPNEQPVLRIAAIDGDPLQDELFFLTEQSSFQDFPLLGAETGNLLGRHQIHSVGDLLAAEAPAVAASLDRPAITAATVQLWQRHMGLMCFVPNLTLNDAQILVAHGIHSPADLLQADLAQLERSITQFLATHRALHHTAARYDLQQLDHWQRGALRNQSRWHQSRWHAARHANRVARPEARPPRVAQAPSTTFYLNREDALEAAPSIGPKTARRFANIGIHSVADFLEADPETTAAALDLGHLSAATLVRWQHQARLVCQIPKLHGYAAQLLVGCGLTDPEQIARLTTHTLVAKVLSFCQTQAGQRILRSADAPTAEKITGWAQRATRARSLEAA